MFVFMEDQKHNLEVTVLWFSLLKNSRLQAVSNTGVIVLSLAYFHFCCQSNTLVCRWRVHREISRVSSCTKSLELPRKLLLDNIGCKVLGDMCMNWGEIICVMKFVQSKVKKIQLIQKFNSKAGYSKVELSRPLIKLFLHNEMDQINDQHCENKQYHILTNKEK